METSADSPQDMAVSTSAEDSLHVVPTDNRPRNATPDDSELTSFIDALWDEQVADASAQDADFHQQVPGSLGSFGGLHILNTELLPQSTIHTYPYNGQQANSSSPSLLTLPTLPCQSQWPSYGYVRYDGAGGSMEQAFEPTDVISTFDHCQSAQPTTTYRESSQGEDVETMEMTEPCYARLLHRCLREAPHYTLTLKEIYVWIKQHTQKARDPKNKGWQNSVRHNLSMNAAFERISTSLNGESKKGSSWRLTQSALRNGVISTTRYRRDPKRKSDRRAAPAPKRQISGAKGGAATRAASQHRRWHEEKGRLARMAHAQAQLRFLPSALRPIITSAPSYEQQHMLPEQVADSTPYFVSSVDTSPVAMSRSLLDPPTPGQMHGMPMLFENQEKGSIGDLQMQHLGYSQELFGSMSAARDFTPSLQTEGSYFTDEDGQPQHMSF